MKRQKLRENIKVDWNNSKEWKLESRIFQQLGKVVNLSSSSRTTDIAQNYIILQLFWTTSKCNRKIKIMKNNGNDVKKKIYSLFLKQLFCALVRRYAYFFLLLHLIDTDLKFRRMKNRGWGFDYIFNFFLTYFINIEHNKRYQSELSNAAINYLFILVVAAVAVWDHLCGLYPPQQMS